MMNENKMSKNVGMYIHIPFCKQKCHYCDFISYSQKEIEIEKYIENVIEEINSYEEELENHNITTIYIGGGTPSYVDSKYITKVLNILEEKLNETNNKTKFEDIEITIEINPGTVNKEKIEEYKKAKINRISIGLQSTNNELLKQIGRIHTYEEFLETYKIIKEVGFENINVDLMLGLPNQTIQDIKTSLEEIKKINPNHISVYSLIIEEGTVIEKQLEQGKIKLPEEEKERQMYWYIKNTLELYGYNHYEISNFAKKGKESKHNMNCWEQEEYIGIGLAAHSYLNNKRYSNIAIEENKDISQWKRETEETQNLEDKKKEYMLLGLRKIEGVSILKFKEKYIENPIFLFRNELEELIKQELLQIDGDNIKLTNKGLDLANLVWEKFI